ncbi:MAG: DUF4446 family protein [Lachnospiraceae bacterium]|jgi:hypothetical protein|uniref:DUF4446 family protein n=1 Tax=Roseburia sp. 1XD42-69 TaxID=2320088 RepID=UPI000EA04FBE|nr:DUF4446 family protein [Roseburia sp. 1XD42-69]MCI8875420.1 DUF4446 family protein [Lachnospiraceae bacterium]RKJ63523.1 DUF4446 family protein [Roseburia sp. 1XD42-69]
MIEYYLGIDSDYVIMGLAALTVLLLLIVFINIIQMHKLKKKYKMFMDGKNAKTLEESILSRMDQIDHLISSTQKNESDIQKIYKNMKTTFQKVGLVKYDAFHEMGGKLSFSLALLNEINDGFIVNAMHSREGCYTYIKEIIDGNSIIALADEEQEALDMAMKSKD